MESKLLNQKNNKTTVINKAKEAFVSMLLEQQRAQTDRWTPHWTPLLSQHMNKVFIMVSVIQLRTASMGLQQDKTNSYKSNNVTKKSRQKLFIYFYVYNSESAFAPCSAFNLLRGYKDHISHINYWQIST